MPTTDSSRYEDFRRNHVAVRVITRPLPGAVVQNPPRRLQKSFLLFGLLLTQPQRAGGGFSDRVSLQPRPHCSHSHHPLHQNGPAEVRWGLSSLRGRHQRRKFLLICSHQTQSRVCLKRRALDEHFKRLPKWQEGAAPSCSSSSPWSQGLR